MDDLNFLGGEATEESLLDAFLRQAQEGEKLIDPRVGKYDDVTVTEVTRAVSEKGHSIIIKWGGLVDGEGREFEYHDRLFCPDRDMPVFVKGRFMAKLKALDVIPKTYENIIYCETEEASEFLRGMIEKKCRGNSYLVELKQDKNLFVSLSVRPRPKAQAA